ncbi:endonuclease V [Halobacteria archaeon AArc-curdl1]|uniref:Endonuclease V n=1 Tax=Natronosalvus hydrolyticus TaxID=2979988 RepID=A0AAP2Z8J0_9EURY|nr:endonuclease V [Halobacteria archaeon AArc-curdl1]
MPSISQPDLVPDASSTRAEMESQQREIAALATFEDRFSFDARRITNPLEAASADKPLEAASTDGTQPIIAGVDQSFLLESEPERALSAIVAMRDGEVLERVYAVTPLEIPYIPGLLAFREGGPILKAMTNLSVEPDLYLFDGSGRIHYRQAGIATHIGVVLDVPAIGVAKSLLCGDPADSLEGLAPGTRVPIEANARVDAPEGTVLGYAVQTRQYESGTRSINPLYVSPGHRVGPETAADLAFGLAAEYKLPEPIRLADRYATTAKREYRA